MENDFVDVFPSAGGVGDSPVKTSASMEQGGNSWSRPSLSLSIPGLDTGGREALVSPAVSGSRGVTSLAKEGVLRSARAVSATASTAVAASREDDAVMLDTPSESSAPAGMGGLTPLTIDPGGECIPTELEKKRAKLEKYRYECSEVSKSFLFVSGEDAAKQQGLVSSKGITHIINCAGPQCPNYLEYTGRFNFLRLNFYDHRTEDCAWFMYRAFDFMKAAQKQRGRVLVHCVQGVSRSCTLAIAWLMLTEGVDYDEAYLRVRTGRPICAPNTSFICSLLEWQRRRQQPSPLPLLYRTAWHVPLFPNDLVLKICLHEDDRSHVIPSLAALDSRGCYLIVLERVNGDSRESAKSGWGGGFAKTGSFCARQRLQRAGSSAVQSTPALTPKAISSSTFRRGNSFEVLPPALTLPSAGSLRPSALPPAMRSVSLLSTPSPAAAKARAAAAAAVIANAKAVAAVAAAKEAQAVAAAAAAEEAVMVAKAVEAGVAVPWTWRGSEVSSAKGKPRMRSAEAETAPPPSGASAAVTVPNVVGRHSPLTRTRPSGRGWEGGLDADEDGGVDVYVWKGAQSSGRMVELAKQGARWLRDYENWGAGTFAPMVEEGHEPPELLRHLEKGSDSREPSIYGDLASPTPPPTAARTGYSSFMTCPTPSAHGGGGGLTGRGAPMLSPAETPTLSPAGPSPSPGGVSLSPCGSGTGVSPAGAVPFGPGLGGSTTISPCGSTTTSPAQGCSTVGTGGGYGGGGGGSRYSTGDGYGVGGYRLPRCSMASATEMDEDMEESENEEHVAMGLSSLGGRNLPSSSGVGGAGPAAVVGGRGCEQDVPLLFELADELGGQGASGLRWSRLAVYDDQDLVPQCCFLLVPPGGQSFLWVGQAFAASLGQTVSTPQQLRALARDVAIRDARRQSDRLLPRVSDVEKALVVPGDRNEPPEWWSAFENGYMC